MATYHDGAWLALTNFPLHSIHAPVNRVHRLSDKIYNGRGFSYNNLDDIARQARISHHLRLAPLRLMAPDAQRFAFALLISHE